MENRSNHDNNLTWIANYYDHQPMWQRCLLLGVAVCLLGVVVDTSIHEVFVHGLGWQWVEEDLLANFLLGAGVVVVAYSLLSARDKRIQRRFQEIGYLNHHIRNALAIIHLAEGCPMEREKRLGMVESASKRIQICLEKVSREEDITKGTALHP